jgi:hypothetical protein
LVHPHAKPRNLELRSYAVHEQPIGTLPYQRAEWSLFWFEMLVVLTMTDYLTGDS